MRICDIGSRSLEGDPDDLEGAPAERLGELEDFGGLCCVEERLLARTVC